MMEVKHFFKIMMPGFHLKLNLPQAVCKKLTHKEKSEKAAVVKTRLGTWRIQLSTDHQGLICFQNGWPDFARRHRLNVGDLVMFKCTGNFQFKAIVFDVSACEKELVDVRAKREPIDEATPKEVMKISPNHHLPKKFKREHSEPLNKGPDITSYQSENPFFILKMTPSHASRTACVWIPQAFWRSKYMEGKKRLILRDGGGKEWRVDLIVQKKGLSRCKLGKRWVEFYADNKLEGGDLCVFELRPGIASKSTDVVMGVRIYRSPV